MKINETINALKWQISDNLQDAPFPFAKGKGKGMGLETKERGMRLEINRRCRQWVKKSLEWADYELKR